jgi:environmental stress-induced protein Ves
MGAFTWRVSIADVRAAGPFSDFHNVDRILSVLEGELSLTVAGGPEMRLTPRDAPFPFPADVPALGAPIDGDVRDLNVMVRRDACRAAIERLQEGTTHVCSGPGPSLMIVATGDATVVHGASIETLQPFDALLFDAPVAESIAVRSAAPSFVIHLESVEAHAAATRR